MATKTQADTFIESRSSASAAGELIVPPSAEVVDVYHRNGIFVFADGSAAYATDAEFPHGMAAVASLDVALTLYRSIFYPAKG